MWSGRTQGTEHSPPKRSALKRKETRRSGERPDSPPQPDVRAPNSGKQVHIGLHASAIAAGSVNFLLPGRTNERMTFIGGIASTQEVMDLCAKEGIMTEIDLQPVSELNRIFEALDSANESGKRFVLDIAGTLSKTASTGAPTQLKPHESPNELLRGVADAMIGRLLPLKEKLDEGRRRGDSASSSSSVYFDAPAGAPSALFAPSAAPAGSSFDEMHRLADDSGDDEQLMPLSLLERLRNKSRNLLGSLGTKPE